MPFTFFIEGFEGSAEDYPLLILKQFSKLIVLTHDLESKYYDDFVAKFVSTSVFPDNFDGHISSDSEIEREKTTLLSQEGINMPMIDMMRELIGNDSSSDDSV